jgi:predicted GNAT family acetyltransferase
MKVELIESVDEFISTTTAFRATDPLRTNVIGSVALSVAEGDRSYDDYRWWIVRGDDGDVAGVAMRTSPFNMNVAPMPIEAARALGHGVGQFDDTLPGVSGSKDIVDALIEGYVASKSPGSTRVPAEQRRDLLYELEDLVTPDVEGSGRLARNEEVEQLARMMSEFMREVELTPISAAEPRDATTRQIQRQSLYCWEVDGAIAAIAGHAPVVSTGSIVIGRVGPVYTPPAYRRRGFASAVTAHVTRRLIEVGARVMLFTDAANPTSNSIYQAIGYRLVDELVEMRFARLRVVRLPRRR